MRREAKESALLSQPELAARAQGWQLEALRDISARLADPDFPCVFSRNAFRKQLVRFVMLDDTGGPGLIRPLAQALREYVELSRAWDGRLDSAYPLVVVFSEDAVRARSVEDYHAFGWWVLQELHREDPGPWPGDVAADPDCETWSMCFAGMPLFCNMSAPAHLSRRSRNLGRYFALVINPRERFDIFAGATPSGRKVRENIRARIHRYDGQEHSPQLGSYGAGALEWRQYGLPDENTGTTGACPFRPIPARSNELVDETNRSNRA